MRRSSPTARPPCARTQREHWPAPQPTSSTSRPATSPSTPARRPRSSALGAPHEAGVAEELAVGGLVLVGVAVPVAAVGPPGLGLVDGTALDAHGAGRTGASVHAPTVVPRDGGSIGAAWTSRLDARWPAAGQRRDVPRRGGGGAHRGADLRRAQPARAAPRRREVDAAVLRLVRGLLPVPEVLEVRRADAATGPPGLLVTSFLPGDAARPAAAGAGRRAARATVGAQLGRPARPAGGCRCRAPGLFVDGDLRVAPLPGRATWSDFVEARRAEHGLGGWTAAEYDGLRRRRGPGPGAPRRGDAGPAWCTAT